LAGGADRLTVIDVETTGFANTDRVVEIAVVTLDLDGRVIDEFETLIDPQRDVGPTWVHRITPSMVAGAPRFEDVSPYLAMLLSGSVCVAHNLPFDRRMLTNEFDRAGVSFHWGTGLDTLAVTGCKLQVACAEYDIALHDAHRAMSDAQATASLLCATAREFGAPGAPASSNVATGSPIEIRTRDGFTVVPAPSPMIPSLSHGVHTSGDTAAYVDLLDRAVADLVLTDAEIVELDRLADDLGLSDDDRRRAHREFLNGLVDAALEDGVVTTDEYEQLTRVAALLGIDDVVPTRAEPYLATSTTFVLTVDQAVCFTGEALSGDGATLARSQLHELTIIAGLVPARGVTKRDGTLLVAADPSSRSGKARTARRHGLPITSVTDFLRALTSDMKVTVLLPNPNICVGVACQMCGRTWTAPVRPEHALCTECEPASDDVPDDAHEFNEAGTRAGIEPPAMETLTCGECGNDWQRRRVRGRRPHRCPDCFDA
jgi:DNA polymerase-3 subunit epsilon